MNTAFLSDVIGMMRRIAPGAFLLLLILSMMGPNVISQTGTIISFNGEISEELQDSDDNGLAEYLKVIVPVTVFQPGSFGLYGTIGDGEVNANTGLVSLSAGENVMTLLIPGNYLRNYVFSGQYVIEVQIFSDDKDDTGISTVYQTSGSYSGELFETPDEGHRTSVDIGDTEVVIRSPSMEVSVNKTSPMLSFSYPGEKGDESRSTLEYLEIIAFNDIDGNGGWDPSDDDQVYRASLDGDIDWTISIDLSSGYQISLRGIVQLRRIDALTVSAWGVVTFTLDSESVNPEGNAQKFDIRVDLYQSLDADHIAVRHELRDDSGDQVIRDGVDLTGINGLPADPYVLVVTDLDGDVHGIYSWGELIETGPGEILTEDQAETEYTIGDGSAEIWFSYPLDEDTLHIYHDPTVGVDPRHIPGPTDDEDFLVNRPLVMAGGILIGIFLVGGSIIIRFFRTGGGRKSEDKGGG